MYTNNLTKAENFYYKLQNQFCLKEILALQSKKYAV